MTAAKRLRVYALVMLLLAQIKPIEQLHAFLRRRETLHAAAAFRVPIPLGLGHAGKVLWLSRTAD